MTHHASDPTLLGSTLQTAIATFGVDEVTKICNEFLAARDVEGTVGRVGETWSSCTSPEGTVSVLSSVLKEGRTEAAEGTPVRLQCIRSGYAGSALQAIARISDADGGWGTSRSRRRRNWQWVNR